MSASKALANTPSFTNLPIAGFKHNSLQVNDLVVWTGSSHQYAQLEHGVIYRVLERQDRASKDGESAHVSYKLGVAFEFNSPIGLSALTRTVNMTNDLKKLSLLDLGIIRMAFDNFIKQWAKDMGHEDTCHEG